MSHTNKTPNYDLPQFIGTDKASWLGDLNPAFLEIDAGMQSNKVAAQTAEVSAGEASALAQSANSVANSANSVAKRALDKIGNWVTYNLVNPDPTNFIRYSGSFKFNAGLGIGSLYNFVEFKDGFTPSFGEDGTILIILPAEYFNNTYSSTLFFSGDLSYRTNDNKTLYANPQYRLSNRVIRMYAIGGYIPSGGQYRYSIISRMYYIADWLK